MITKYFAYCPESESALDGHTMYTNWVDAAVEAMRDDLYAFKCREINEADLPIRFNVVDATGHIVDYFDNREDAEKEAAELSEDGELHSIQQVADESDYTIGDFGLWVHSNHSWGNNCYEPIGVNHHDFTGITGSDIEDCLREYSNRGDSAFIHPRHHVIVAEAKFDLEGNLIEADGISVDAEENEE